MMRTADQYLLAALALSFPAAPGLAHGSLDVVHLSCAEYAAKGPDDQLAIRSMLRMELREEGSAAAERAREEWSNLGDDAVTALFASTCGAEPELILMDLALRLDPESGG